MSINIADVYYVPRSGTECWALNQLTQAPASLTRVDVMTLARLAVTAGIQLGSLRAGGTGPVEPTGAPNLLGVPYGLYYLNEAGVLWCLVSDGGHPDLPISERAHVAALIQVGIDNLGRLCREAASRD